MASSYDPASVEQEGNSIITLVMKSIEIHQHDDLSMYLDLFPLITLDPDTSYSLLELFALKAFDEDNIPAAAIVVKKWADTNPEEDIRPTIVQLFRMHGFPQEFYKFLMKNYPRLTFSDLMIKLNNFDQEIPTLQAADRIGQHFGPQNMEIYEEILANLADNQESPINPVVYSSIESLMREANTINVKPKPQWIVDPPFIVDGGLPTQEELVRWANERVEQLGLNNDGLDEANPEKLARYLVEVYRDLVNIPDTFSIISHLHAEPITDPESAIEIITQRLSQANFSDMRKSLLEQIRAAKQATLITDPFLFRVFGSSYFSQGDRILDSTNEDPCLRYGGCRESLCWEYDNYDTDDEVIIPDIHETHEYDQLEWFTGECQQCGIRILQKHYARRMPMFNGGWSGCYCSEACLINSTYSDKDSRIVNIKRTTELLQTIGIYDRVWPKVETKPFKYIPVEFPYLYQDEPGELPLEVNTGVNFSSTPFGPIIFRPEKSASSSSLNSTIVAPVEFPSINSIK